MIEARPINFVTARSNTISVLGLPKVFSTDIDELPNPTLMAKIESYAKAEKSLVRVYRTKKGIRLANYTQLNSKISNEKALETMLFLGTDKEYRETTTTDLNPYEESRLEVEALRSAMGMNKEYIYWIRISPKFYELPLEFYKDNGLEPYYTGQFFFGSYMHSKFYMGRGGANEISFSKGEFLFKENHGPKTKVVKELHDNYNKLMEFYNTNPKYGVFEHFVDFNYGELNPELISGIKFLETKTKANLKNKILI